MVKDHLALVFSRPKNLLLAQPFVKRQQKNPIRHEVHRPWPQWAKTSIFYNKIYSNCTEVLLKINLKD